MVYFGWKVRSLRGFEILSRLTWVRMLTFHDLGIPLRGSSLGCIHIRPEHLSVVEKLFQIQRYEYLDTRMQPEWKRKRR